MSDYEKICNFTNLYHAHRKARLGKRGNREVILFETDLAGQLFKLYDALYDHSYRIGGYYQFTVHDPKERVIHALRYPDRVVQHCLCDEVLAPILDKRLIYDNAACRVGKGTHFALKRLTKFLSDAARTYGTDLWALKCDIRKYFDHIDHRVLKEKLSRVIEDRNVFALLEHIIDSYETEPGKGLPLGNQSSQWFALYYLDGLDRMVKEQFRVRGYVRYMDDFILIHPDKEFLRACLHRLKAYLEQELKLEFNEKTQILPMKNGIGFLGFHFYLSETGKVIRKVRGRTKTKYRRRLREMMHLYREGSMDASDVHQVLSSYKAHLDHGHTGHLQAKFLNAFFLQRRSSSTPHRHAVLRASSGSYPIILSSSEAES